MTSGLQIYWYWPFARNEQMGLVTGSIRPGDELTVHTVDRPNGPPSQEGPGYRVVASLPDVRELTERSPGWYLSRPRTYLDRASARRRAVAATDFDVVHVMFQNYFTDWYALDRLARRAVLVSSVHDVVPHQPRLPRRFQLAVLRRVYRRSGHLVVHHDSLKHRLLEQFNVPAERVSVIPHQVPPTYATPRPRGLRSKPIREVLFFGTFRRNKGIEVLIEAIGLLAHRDDLRFRFAGRGFADIESLVSVAAGRDGRITAEIGWVSDERKGEVFAGADLVVMPYTAFASQSGVLHDAYSFGLPVVTTNVGALGSTVQEDRTGWVVKPGSARSLASAIDTAFLSADAYESVCRASWSIAKARHPAVIGRQLRALYQRLIEEQRP